MNGGAGIPVNSWTMARKLVVSVVRTVVGARREARDLFFGFLAKGLLLEPPLPLLLVLLAVKGGCSFGADPEIDPNCLRPSGSEGTGKPTLSAPPPRPWTWLLWPSRGCSCIVGRPNPPRSVEPESGRWLLDQEAMSRFRIGLGAAARDAADRVVGGSKKLESGSNTGEVREWRAI